MNSHWSGYSAVLLLHDWCHVKLLPSRRQLCVHYTTIQPCTSLQCHFIRSHIRRLGRVCFFSCNLLKVFWSVTCHLHCWQNDRNLLRPTAATRGWNGYKNKSQHRNLTSEKKILPPLLLGLEPETVRSRVRCSATEPSPLPLKGEHLLAPDSQLSRPWFLRPQNPSADPDEIELPKAIQVQTYDAKSPNTERFKRTLILKRTMPTFFFTWKQHRSTKKKKEKKKLLFRFSSHFSSFSTV